MASFYPYVSPTTIFTTPYTCNTTTTTIQAAQATPTAVMAEQNAVGMSLATADVIGIVAGVLILFSGLAWFVYRALAVLLRRKRILLKEKKGQGNREV
jgi:hypothetical protein